MHASYYFEIFKKNKSKVALIWNDNEFTYYDLSEKIDEIRKAKLDLKNLLNDTE